MTPDPTFEESYATFLSEAQDILNRIEQDLLNLGENRSIDKVHRLMRSAHTLKGAAASVEMETIKQVAHILEDIFKALYNPDVTIDAEVETLLFEGYECLRLLVIVEVTGGQVDAQSVLNRAAAVITKLHEKLGDGFNPEAPLPTSLELGFDIVQSMFEVTVEQRLQELEQSVSQGNPEAVQSELLAKADLFSGLAESLGLPGFGAIAQATQAALEAHPEQAITIAQLALQDFSQGREAVLAGDRTQGGSPCSALQALAAAPPDTNKENPDAVAADVERKDISAIPDEESIEESISDRESLGTGTPQWSLDDLFSDIKLHQPTATPPQEEPNSAPLFSQKPAVDSASYTVLPASESPEPPRVEPVRVEVEQLQSLDYLVGELLINQNQQTNQDQQFRAIVQALRSDLSQHQRTLYQLQDTIERLLSQAGWENSGLFSAAVKPHVAEKAFPAGAFTATFDVLEMERYTDLRVLLQSAINQTVQLDKTTENVAQLTRHSRQTLDMQRRLMSQVRDDLTALRLYPLRDLVNRFPRLLQQLATAHEKPAELILSGTDVLIDKTITEKLYDPLLHLIRNAFAHGIELPTVRRAQGKPEVGRIEIRATRQGNQTVIEVKDDGRGIELQRVAQRARELKLIPPEPEDSVSESQLLELLFQPGFSTAAQLSDLSGRGIGLDVVNSQLKAINGSIAVSTAPQQGTTFTLKIPLSLTTTRLLVCQAQGFTYALPVEPIKQIVVPSPEHLQVLGEQQLILQWQPGQTQEQQVISIFSLSHLVHYGETSARLRPDSPSDLAAPPQPTPNLRHSRPVLLLQTIHGLRGLSVDRVLGEQELVIRSLATTINPPPYVSGCCILSDRHPALAIDVEVLMQLSVEVDYSSSQSFSSQSLLPQQTADFPPAGVFPGLASHLMGQSANQATDRPQLPHSKNPSKTILIVDDSLTLRHNLALLFNSAGYTVLQAGDGLEALAQLRHPSRFHSRIDAVICDLEMPHLNGFELLNQLQQDAVLSRIPVVVLTSRGSAKHRKIAQTLGAAAYFTKPYDRDELLITVECLLQAALLH